MRLRTLLVGITMFCAMSYASTASKLFNNENYYVGEGDIEVRFAVDPNFFRAGGETLSSFSFGVGGNYFINDMFAPGIDFEVYDLDGSSSVFFFPHLKVYWNQKSRVLPYALAGMGYADYYGSGGFDIGLGGGINYLLARNVAIGAGVRYDMIFADGSTLHAFQIPVGFTLYFGL